MDMNLMKGKRMSKYRVEKITDQIILLRFEKQEDLTRTFLRFQEHYESPNEDFRKRPFTLGEYRDWYSRNYGGWTYYTDWSGFNIPSYILEDFRKGLFDPLTEDERDLLDRFKYRNDKFYIIGTYNGIDERHVLEHEIIHGLYYVDDAYRKNVQYIIENDISEIYDVRDFILNQGYNEEVLLDEVNACIAVEFWVKYFSENGLHMPSFHLSLRNLKEKYFEKHGIDLEKV